MHPSIANQSTHAKELSWHSASTPFTHFNDTINILEIGKCNLWRSVAFFRAQKASGSDQNISKIANNRQLVPRESPISYNFICYVSVALTTVPPSVLSFTYITVRTMDGYCWKDASIRLLLKNTYGTIEY